MIDREKLNNFKNYFTSLGKVNRTTEQIIKYLEHNLFEDAQAEFYHDGDKIRQHRELYNRVVQLLGCRLHGVKNCTKWICSK